MERRDDFLKSYKAKATGEDSCAFEHDKVQKSFVTTKEQIQTIAQCFTYMYADRSDKKGIKKGADLCLNL